MAATFLAAAFFTGALAVTFLATAFFAGALAGTFLAAAFFAGALAVTFLAAAFATGFLATAFLAGAFLATGALAVPLPVGFLEDVVLAAVFFGAALVLALDFLVAMADYLITELIMEAVKTPQKGLLEGGLYSTLLQRGREATRLVALLPLNLHSIPMPQ